MMSIQIKRTDSDNEDFRRLIAMLDQDLAVRNGESNGFFAQFNKVDSIRNVVLAYDGIEPIGCGAMKEYEPGVMEVKRMFVPRERRGQGAAVAILQELEKWAAELDYHKCILETGDKMPEAIGLYKKSSYQVIPNYGQYAGVDSSICFEKVLQ